MFIPIRTNVALIVSALILPILACAEHVVLERSGDSCSEDPNCFNRLHPDIPPVKRVQIGDLVTFQSRGSDIQLPGPSAINYLGVLPKGPHYTGPGTALGRMPDRFYATTGLPIKESGELPSYLEYLQSPVAPGLENLSDNLMLAARNALLEMIRYLTGERGLTRDQAYLLASVAVDLRIGQVVDAGNVNVTAILPLDIFVDEPADASAGEPE